MLEKKFLSEFYSDKDSELYVLVFNMDVGRVWSRGDMELVSFPFFSPLLFYIPSLSIESVSNLILIKLFFKLLFSGRSWGPALLMKVSVFGI